MEKGNTGSWAKHRHSAARLFTREHSGVMMVNEDNAIFLQRYLIPHKYPAAKTDDIGYFVPFAEIEAFKKEKKPTFFDLAKT